MMVKKILPLGLVVVVGMLFMLGSEVDPHVPRPSVNHSNLTLSQKIELEKLQQELEFWRDKNIKATEAFVIFSKRDKRNAKVTENKDADGRVVSVSRVTTISDATKEAHKEVFTTSTRMQQIEAKIDKIAIESRKSCFPPETQVLLSDGSLKAISALQEGDSVTVYDIATDNISVSAIDEVLIDTNNHYYVLNGTVKATAYERFLTKEGWKRIRYIQKGDAIFDGNSYQNVESIEKIHVSDTVYNLSIKDNHNFFVSHDGSTQMLVHNTPSGGGGSSGGGSGGGSSK
jgi:intein/homing endonuclease